jgi:hypothetical protein
MISVHHTLAFNDLLRTDVAANNGKDEVMLATITLALLDETRKRLVSDTQVTDTRLPWQAAALLIGVICVALWGGLIFTARAVLGWIF